MADPKDKAFFDAIVADERGAAALRILSAIVSGDNAIERAIEWIGDNMDPQSVFPREKLDEWARMAGYVLPT